MLYCPGAVIFAEKFCPGTGLLTTSKKFPVGLPRAKGMLALGID